jgi:hypothetical protein
MLLRHQISGTEIPSARKQHALRIRPHLASDPKSSRIQHQQNALRLRLSEKKISRPLQELLRRCATEVEVGQLSGEASEATLYRKRLKLGDHAIELLQLIAANPPERFRERRQQVPSFRFREVLLRCATGVVLQAFESPSEFTKEAGRSLHLRAHISWPLHAQTTGQAHPIAFAIADGTDSVQAERLAQERAHAPLDVRGSLRPLRGRPSRMYGAKSSPTSSRVCTSHRSHRFFRASSCTTGDSSPTASSRVGRLPTFRTGMRTFTTAPLFAFVVFFITDSPFREGFRSS